MTSGVSTACLYPLETEKSLDALLRAGFRTFEIFFNSHSEITPEFAASLRERLDAFGARAISCHFYTSGFEPFMLFTAYRRRFEDGLALYARYCSVFAITGARYAVFHGDRRDSELPISEYCERFARLNEAARSEGMTLAQENVSRCPQRDGGKHRRDARIPRRYAFRARRKAGAARESEHRLDD
jgi:sugar phosphate isomerase/epimerase